MRKVCVQFQPDRVVSAETNILAAFRRALPDAKFIDGEDDGRYSNIMFEAESPQNALFKLHVIFNSPEIGLAAQLSCIVTCEGKHGWEDYLLLHHYDRTLITDALPNE